MALQAVAQCTCLPVPDNARLVQGACDYAATLATLATPGDGCDVPSVAKLR